MYTYKYIVLFMYIYVAMENLYSDHDQKWYIIIISIALIAMQLFYAMKKWSDKC